MLLTFPFTFIFLRQMHHSAQSLFHHNLDRILTHFGDIQRLGNGIRGSTVRNNCRAETSFDKFKKAGIKPFLLAAILYCWC